MKYSIVDKYKSGKTVEYAPEGYTYMIYGSPVVNNPNNGAVLLYVDTN